MADRPPDRSPLAALILVVAGYLILVATSYATFVRDLLAVDLGVDRDALVRATLAQELADAALVAAMFVLVPRPPHAESPGAWRAWVLALPLLAAVLAVNFGYQYVVRALIESAGVPVPEVVDITLDYGVWAILLVCVQPAVVEELLFRHLFLGHLRPHVGVHGAVWVSAAAFALAHVGRGAAWTLLALVGGFLGYARVRSGSLLLPVALHFLHNLAVLWVEARYGV